MWKIGLPAAAAALALLLSGWGYWQAISHGALNVSVQDTALKNDRQSSGPVLNAELSFVDASGKILAQGGGDERLGIFLIRHPVVGDCRREEREATADSKSMTAWQRCFETQSRWLMTWVRDVRYADVKVRDCKLERVPVSVEQYLDEWWLWWLPLPHVGGKPYTYFHLTVSIDSRACAKRL